MKSLKDLRESSGLTQTQVSQRTGISTARLSLAENGFGRLRDDEKRSVRRTILELSNERADEVLKSSDRYFRRALQLIESQRGHKKLFESLTGKGYSQAQAAAFILGQDYPGEENFIWKG
jgi:transcriptional regulator with XRE-family HTH domain